MQLVDTQMDKNLNRAGVNDSLFSIETLSDGIFCYDSFPSTSMSGYQNTFVPLYSVYRNFLEWIELELVFPVRLGWWNML